MAPWEAAPCPLPAQVWPLLCSLGEGGGLSSYLSSLVVQQPESLGGGVGRRSLSCRSGPGPWAVDYIGLEGFQGPERESWRP